MKRSILYILVICSSYVYGQGLFDSTQVGLVAGGRNTYYDTVLHISNYHQFNDYSTDAFGLISMGNQGDIRRRLVFQTYLEVQPYLGIDGYFKNFSKEGALPYYNVRAASGGIRFLTGYEKGQLFGLHFTINPISRLNVFVDFQRLNSRGNYFNQQNKGDQLLISSSYYSKNGAYKVNGGLQWNKSANLEWGGIADTLDFQDNILGNRELIPIQLNQSASVARQLRLSLDQQFRLLNLKRNELSLFYNVKTISQSYTFSSSDSLFTKSAVFQEAPIRDSIRFAMVENFAGLIWSINQDSLTSLKGQQVVEFGAIQYSHVYGNAYSKQVENNLGLHGRYSGNWRRFSWRADGNLMLSNDYAGTFRFHGVAVYSLLSKSYILFSAQSQNAAPAWFAQRFISNNFIWENNFNNAQRTGFLAKLKLKEVIVTAGADFLTNWIYFNQQAKPEQIAATFGVYYGEAQGTLPLGAGFYLDSRLRYQYTSNESVVRIPNWVIREVLYFERDVFRSAARIQTGVEFNYFSRFTSESYMPATSVMYLQDDIHIGNFPYFNFLFNFKIKEFTFFLRLENVTQGLFKYNYYAAPYYPLPDFALRVGATWRFFN